MGYKSDFSTDILKCVPIPVIEEYIKTFIYDFPDSLHIYSFSRVLLKWKAIRSDLDVSFLSPEGEPKNGIIISWIRNEHFFGTIYAKDDCSIKKLEEALETVKDLVFLKSRSAVFTCMSEKSFKPLKKLVSGNDWCITPSVVFWIPWYAARETTVNLPKDVELRELVGDNAKEINSAWSYQHPDSEQFFRDTIEMNLGFGVFRREKLVSWMLLCFFGGIDILQTGETEKMKGYGRAVLEAITKRLGEMQFDIHLSVNVQNRSALAFFKAVGFRYAFNSVWASRRN